MGVVIKALAISLRSGNSTFAPSGWFMHAWSHIYAVTRVMEGLVGLKTCRSIYRNH